MFAPSFWLVVTGDGGRLPVDRCGVRLRRDLIEGVEWLGGSSYCLSP